MKTVDCLAFLYAVGTIVSELQFLHIISFILQRKEIQSNHVFYIKG